MKAKSQPRAVSEETRKPPGPDEPAQTAGVEVETCADTRDFAAVDSVLADYIAQERLDGETYRASLYQYDKANKTKQSLIEQLSGAIMSPHDVGLTYGSGEYRYVVTWPGLDKEGKPRIKAFRFNIGPSYDLKRALVAGAPAPGQQQAPQGPDAMSQAMSIVQQLLLLARAMNVGKPADGAAGAGDPVLGMVNTHVAVQQCLQQAAMQYVEFMAETRKRIMKIQYDAGVDTIDEEEEEESDQLLEQLKALAVQFIPKLLGDGIGAKTTAAAIRGLPQFRKIVNDGPKLSHLLNELEKDLGKEKVDAACARLKIRRPAPAAAPAKK